MSRLIAVTAAIMLFAACSFAQESWLLTDNGLANPENTAYAEEPMHPTGGAYEVTPPLAAAEEGKTRYTFAEGAFTNGDPSFDYRREPNPYAYWQGQAQGELLIDLGAAFRIDRLRICMLSRDEGPHGTEQIEVSVKGDPLEFPEALRVGNIAPVADGWNELAVNRVADGLRLVFRLGEGETYITISEVEVWGAPVEGGEAQATTVSADSPQRTEGGHTWWAFDFGPPDSPVFAQFHASDSRAAYSQEKGFGWMPYLDGQPVTESNFGPASAAIPGLGERDRGGIAADALYRDLLMVSEYYHTQVRQTFAVDVPNGTWRVMTFHGDQAFGSSGPQNFWIEAEGERVVDEVVYPQSLMTDVVFDAVVQDGRLEITLDAEHEDPAKRSWAINGMVVLPATTPEERQFADAKIEQIRATFERLKQEAFEQNFVEMDYPEYGEMVEPTDADRARGFIGWAPNWMEYIYLHAVPTAETAGRELAATATPGEYEPATVAICALEPLTNVRVEVGDLQMGAATIPASAVEVRKVVCWPQKIGSSWGKEWRTVPELLELFESVDVDADTAQQFWLTVQVPEDAAPGAYSGPVRVIADSGEWATELKLTVLPFALEPAERPVGMYWHDTGVEGKRMDAQIRDMVEHGCTAVTLNTGPKIANVDGQLQYDDAEVLALLQRLYSMGITGPIPYYPPIEGTVKRHFPDNFEAMYIEVIRRLQVLSDREDTPQLMFYPVDEIGNHDERGEKANYLCGLIGQVPGAVSYITVNNYAAGEKWGDTFDIWCGNIEYTAEQEERLLASGKRYMRYGPAYLYSCRQARNSSGLGFYRRPAEAMYYWHYQHAVGDPYNDFDGTSRDHCAAYPGEDGPIPTLDWESIREGVDDMRYIATLKSLAARAEQGNAAQQAAAAAALGELDAVLSLTDAVNQYSYGEDLSDEEYAALRTRLIDHILALRTALAE